MRAAGVVRTCVGCRDRAPAAGLLRVVLRAGRVVPDPGMRFPGRGAWIHPSMDCVQQATRRKAWARALRANGSVDATDVENAVRVRV